MNCCHNIESFRDGPECDGEEKLSQRTDLGAIPLFIHLDGGRSGPQYPDTDFLELVNASADESGTEKKEDWEIGE